MRKLLISTATAFVLAAATPAPAGAQVVVYDSRVPTPPGFYVVNTPPFYNGLSFNNGVITAFPTYPVYPSYGYPIPGPHVGYPWSPGRYPFHPGGYPGFSGYSGPWRP
jgi:hypothetical protein